MVMKKLSSVVLAVALAAAGSAQAAGNAAAGKAKAMTCKGCHGAGGHSTNPMYPKLAGQHAAYIVKALKAYKSGDRKDPTMKAMSAGLNDADIANLAAYYSSQKP
jgi:cytochrome c553